MNNNDRIKGYIAVVLTVGFLIVLNTLRLKNVKVKENSDSTLTQEWTQFKSPDGKFSFNYPKEYKYEIANNKIGGYNYLIVWANNSQKSDDDKYVDISTRYVSGGIAPGTQYHQRIFDTRPNEITMVNEYQTDIKIRNFPENKAFGYIIRSESPATGHYYLAATIPAGEDMRDIYEVAVTANSKEKLDEIKGQFDRIVESIKFSGN